MILMGPVFFKWSSFEGTNYEINFDTPLTIVIADGIKNNARLEPYAHALGVIFSKN
jgi:hypothetical protein